MTTYGAIEQIVSRVLDKEQIVDILLVSYAMHNLGNMQRC